jgi:hypothetical protein
MTKQCTFIQNILADLPDEMEPIQSQFKTRISNIFLETKEMAGKMVNKERAAKSYVIK